jgi:hypothetical protein
MVYELSLCELRLNISVLPQNGRLPFKDMVVGFKRNELRGRFMKLSLRDDRDALKSIIDAE